MDSQEKRSGPFRTKIIPNSVDRFQVPVLPPIQHLPIQSSLALPHSPSQFMAFQQPWLWKTKSPQKPSLQTSSSLEVHAPLLALSAIALSTEKPSDAPSQQIQIDNSVRAN